MKKMRLLFTFTLLSISALNGMDHPGNSIDWKKLPKNSKSTIDQYVQRHNGIVDLVEDMKLSSFTDDELKKIINPTNDKLRNFTALAHILAYEFNLTTQDVAELFETPAAKYYLQLGFNLLSAAENHSPIKYEQLKKLIADGADINFSANNTHPNRPPLTPIRIAIQNKGNENIKLLLAHGAKPKERDVTLAEELTLPKEIQQLIKEAIKTNDNKKRRSQ